MTTTYDPNGGPNSGCSEFDPGPRPTVSVNDTRVTGGEVQFCYCGQVIPAGPALCVAIEPPVSPEVLGDVEIVGLMARDHRDCAEAACEEVEETLPDMIDTEDGYASPQLHW